MAYSVPLPTAVRRGEASPWVQVLNSMEVRHVERVDDVPSWIL